MRKVAVEKRQPIGGRAGRCGSFPTISLDSATSQISPLVQYSYVAICCKDIPVKTCALGDPLSQLPASRHQARNKRCDHLT
jgi:hypothetical protein